MPDQYRVKIVPAAHHDLEEIDDFISVNSPQNAKSVTTELYTEIESLSIFPHRYKIYEDNHDASEIVHSMRWHRSLCSTELSSRPNWLRF